MTNGFVRTRKHDSRAMRIETQRHPPKGWRKQAEGCENAHWRGHARRGYRAGGGPTLLQPQRSSGTARLRVCLRA